MSEATKCDRCGTYIDKSTSDMPRIAYCYDIKSERFSISLCYECYDRFLKEYGLKGGSID